MKEAFLICALSLPASNFTKPAIVSWHMASDEQQEADLRDWLRKHDEIDEVYIHEKPQEDKLKEHGWERVPFTIKGKQIWIKRSPKTDQKLVEASA